MRRLTAVLALLVLAGCSDPTGPGDGRPCSPGESDCREIMDRLTGPPHGFELITYLEDGTALYCPTSEDAFSDPRTGLGNWWRCDWRRY